MLTTGYAPSECSRAFGDAIHDLLVGGPAAAGTADMSEGGEAAAPPDGAGALPDVTCVVLAQAEGYGLNVALQSVRATGADLASLAGRQTWPEPFLAAAEVFRRIPFASGPAGSGHGRPAWHWNAEAAAGTSAPPRRRSTGARRLRTGATLVPRARSHALLPPSRFFTDHGWLARAPAAPPGAGDPLSAGWDEERYPNSAHTVWASSIRLIPAHVCTTSRIKPTSLGVNSRPLNRCDPLRAFIAALLHDATVVKKWAIVRRKICASWLALLLFFQSRTRWP